MSTTIRKATIATAHSESLRPRARTARAFFSPLATFACAFALAGSYGCSDGDGPAVEEIDEPTPDACEEAPGIVCTWAGTGKAGFNNDGKPILESHLYWPVDVTFDPAGQTYVVDFNNHRVREIKKGVFRTVVGTDFIGDGPDDLSDLKAPGAIGTEVLLNHPTQVVPTPSGKPIVVSWHNHKLREYDPETGRVLVICGSGPGFGGDGADAHKAKLNQPNQLVIAEDGTEYILDQRNQVVRRVNTDGIIETVVGTPTVAGFAGDDGPPTEARLNFPAGSNPPPAGGLALDKDGNLYISDTANHRIRKVDFENNVITTLAGTGEAGFAGDDGPAIEAELNGPRKLTLGPDGRLYVGDEHNNRIRAINLKTGEITTVAGNGKAEFAGDGKTATKTALNRPAGVTFDDDGNMYILDTFNNRIRRVLAD